MDNHNHDKETAAYWRYAQFCAEQIKSHPIRFSLASRQLYIQITKSLPDNFSADDIAAEYDRLSRQFSKIDVSLSNAKSILDLSLGFHDSMPSLNTTEEKNEAFIAFTANTHLLANCTSQNAENINQLFQSITSPSRKAFQAASKHIKVTQNENSLYRDWRACSRRQFKLRSIKLRLIDRKINQYSKLYKKKGKWDKKYRYNLLLQQRLSSWIDSKHQQPHINRDSRLTSAITLLEKLKQQETHIKKQCKLQDQRKKTVIQSAGASFTVMALLTATHHGHHLPLGLPFLGLAALKSSFIGSIAISVKNFSQRFFKKNKDNHEITPKNRAIKYKSNKPSAPL